jgi:phage baseplate assembly protein W
MSEFLGRGWAFPITLGADGEVASAALEEDVRQAILIILGTEPGERLMRPDFGAGLRALTFEPNTTTTQALAQHRIEQALARWEPRIDSVTVAIDGDGAPGQLQITLGYRVRTTNTFYNLVYPFYLAEGRPA